MPHTCCPDLLISKPSKMVPPPVLPIQGVKNHVCCPPPSTPAEECSANMKQVCVVIPGWNSNFGPDNSSVANSSHYQRNLTQSRPNSPVSALGANDITPERAELRKDEDAFTPSRIEEFQQWAGGRGGNPSSGGKGRREVAQAEPLRLPPSICIQAPARTCEEGGGTPHLFPALKERPLTCGLSPRGRGESKVDGTPVMSGLDKDFCSRTAGAVCSGEMTLDGNRVMGPASASSASRNARIIPRGVSLFSSARRIRVARKQKSKEGALMMKPVEGQPGIVSLHGKGARTIPYSHHQHTPSHPDLYHNIHPRPPSPDDMHKQYLHQQYLQVPEPRYPHSGDQWHRFTGDGRNQRALPDVVTSGSSVPVAPPTSVRNSNGKTNLPETTHMLYPALLPKPPVTGEGFTKPCDRLARSGRVQTAIAQVEDWNLTENTHRLSIHHTPADDGASVPQTESRPGQGPPASRKASKGTEFQHELKRFDNLCRARTAPVRRQGHPTSDMSVGARPEDYILPGNLPEEDQPPSFSLCGTGSEDDLAPRLAVVELQLSQCPTGRSLNLHSSTTTPRRLANLTVSRNACQGPAPTPFTSPSSTNMTSNRSIQAPSSANISSNRNSQIPLMHLDFKPPYSEASEHVEQAKKLDSPKVSARRRRHGSIRPEHDRKDKWDRWRIRLSISAKHGNRKRLSTRM